MRPIARLLAMLGIALSEADVVCAPKVKVPVRAGQCEQEATMRGAHMQHSFVQLPCFYENLEGVLRQVNGPGIPSAAPTKHA
jgi:hypothetical protein